MGIYRTIAGLLRGPAAIIALIVIALGSGWWLAGRLYYQPKINTMIDEKQRMEIAQGEAITEYENTLQKSSDEWYEKWRAASNSGVITERVYVTAKCPVPDKPTRGMDDGGATAKAELTEATIRSLNRVIEEAESLYSQCAHSLRAHQERALIVPKPVRVRKRSQ